MINFVMESFVNSNRKNDKVSTASDNSDKRTNNKNDKVTIINGITTLCQRIIVSLKISRLWLRKNYGRKSWIKKSP